MLLTACCPTKRSYGWRAQHSNKHISLVFPLYLSKFIIASLQNRATLFTKDDHTPLIFKINNASAILTSDPAITWAIVCRLSTTLDQLTSMSKRNRGSITAP